MGHICIIESSPKVEIIFLAHGFRRLSSWLLGQKELCSPGIVLYLGRQEAARENGTGVGIYFVTQSTEHSTVMARTTFKHIPPSDLFLMPGIHFLKFTPPSEDQACSPGA